jgi:16S rRNA (guanine966-N2)-methyltransferase
MDHRFSVRIIGGRWRGRRIVIPHGTTVRPTPDRVRETVFNWLTGTITGAACLDLFAGTGVFGLEALSRGAREAWFVERDAELARAIRARVSELLANARVLQTDVEALLRQPPARQFDVVFLDPPYQLPLDPLLTLIEPWLADVAQLYVERPRPRANTPALDRLVDALPSAELIKQSKAGAVVFGLLQFRRS